MDNTMLHNAMQTAWHRITPFWPLKNLIAVNPLSGFEDLPFEKALDEASAFFEKDDLPAAMREVNRETIKWLQVFFDEGQATIQMPLKELGLWSSIKKIIGLDHLSDDSSQVIREMLTQMKINPVDQPLFLTLMLTTLPGWSSYVKHQSVHRSAVLGQDYFALRLFFTSRFYQDPSTLLKLSAVTPNQNFDRVNQIKSFEKIYMNDLLDKLTPKQSLNSSAQAEAQLVFCIDVRSEPFRKALEQQGHYETFGFAGFFGLPIGFSDQCQGESYAACPVLINPSYEIRVGDALDASESKKINRTNLFRKMYQSLKFNMLTPFALVELLGVVAAFFITKNTFKIASPSDLKKIMPTEEAINRIPLEARSAFASQALRGMSLIENFSDLVVFCGHGAQTKNNPYASALDCGACAGRQGGANALVLSTILNQGPVRDKLREEGITIPDRTLFVAAEHCTTTDHCHILSEKIPSSHQDKIRSLQSALDSAQKLNLLNRGKALNDSDGDSVKKRANDWAQVRPEWGLAGNASFIVSNRKLTKDIDLKGRSFLHSYDWRLDHNAEVLTTILTAPVVVAQWINAQYLFSSLNNVAYGGGSKVTQNITGKIGIMQGNASDLMNGLALQSVAQSDKETYHEPIRLHTVICAPQERIKSIIVNTPLLSKLISHEWIFILCLDPQTKQTLKLNKDFEWNVIAHSASQKNSENHGSFVLEPA